jgi:hypothetical protein
MPCGIRHGMIAVDKPAFCFVSQRFFLLGLVQLMVSDLVLVTPHYVRLIWRMRVVSVACCTLGIAKDEWRYIVFIS